MKSSIQLTFVLLFFSGLIFAKDSKDPASTGNNAKETAAINHILILKTENGLSAEDIANPILTDTYQSKQSQVTHFFYKQQIDGIQIENATLNVHIKPDNSVLFSRSQFIPNAKSLVIGSAKGISALNAVQIAAKDRKLQPNQLTTLSNKNNLVTFSEADIRLESMKKKLNIIGKPTSTLMTDQSSSNEMPLFTVTSAHQKSTNVLITPTITQSLKTLTQNNSETGTLVPTELCL